MYYSVMRRKEDMEKHQLNIRVGENIYKMLCENVAWIQEDLDKVEGITIKYDMSKCIRDAIIDQHNKLSERKFLKITPVR